MARKRKRRLKKLLTYHRAVKGPGRCLCILDRVLGREVVRRLRVGGIELFIRSGTKDMHVAISSLYEKEYDAIRCADPKVIIDAGANIGTSALFFARKYPRARILAIEPEAGNFDLLQKNTAPYENIVPVKAALWGRDEQRTVQSRLVGPWGYTVSETANALESTGQIVPCMTLESLMRTYHIEAIDVLKMDIEGAEKNVLENAAGWIDAVGIMTVELHDRICMGCSRAFYLATKDFKTFEKHGEKVTAYKG